MNLTPVNEKVPLTRLSYNLKYEEFRHFDIPWHVHPEYEIALILKSRGKYYVGDEIAPIEENELLFLGSGLPHSWKNNDPHDGRLIGKQIIIQFREDCLGPGFFNIPETAHIREMFNRSARGIRFFGAARESINVKLKKIFSLNDFQKMLSFLDILGDMAVSDEYELLSSQAYTGRLQPPDTERLDRINAYIIENFRKEVNLKEISAQLGLTPQALCNYVKKKTWKTFTHIVNEVRIGHACKLLLQTGNELSQVAYESGYNNISHFYRQFRKHTGLSPAEYRNSFSGRAENVDIFRQLNLL